MDCDIQVADALSWTKGLPTHSVDCIITDPPYDTLDEHRAVGTTTRLGQWFDTMTFEDIEKVLCAAVTRLRADGHMYVICDWITARRLPHWLAHGFILRKPIIWDKMTLGMGYHYRCRYEVIMMYSADKARPLNDLGVPDVLQYPRLTGPQYYPTAKPPDLIEVLVRQSTQPGELIVDPFVGGGSVAVAAIRTGRRFAGCDISPEAVERSLNAVNSMEQLTLI
jgi:site-specific DNA-methyltransferase (adenine-specific)